MPKIVFIQHTGESQTVEARPGQSVMEAATANMVRGIIGECGGSCSCATCHVYVDRDWFERLPAADTMELGMLEGAVEPGPLSRLSCQIKVTEDLDGLVARIPAGQA
ncbi:MAG: 2Fe-2S iron-sulfur cluster binding domain-containing protein [Gammaproteobacteria bacterium]|nr:2Fe-2S iron-sulfur cluster binding domain-containing protein [Gammaproteobacteria bacterium]